MAGAVADKDEDEGGKGGGGLVATPLPRHLIVDTFTGHSCHRCYHSARASELMTKQQSGKRYECDVTGPSVRAV